MIENANENGWQYGDNSWQHFMNKPGPNTFTRKKKWRRLALLVEKQIAFIEEQRARHVHSSK